MLYLDRLYSILIPHYLIEQWQVKSTSSSEKAIPNLTLSEILEKRKGYEDAIQKKRVLPIESSLALQTGNERELRKALSTFIGLPSFLTEYHGQKMVINGSNSYAKVSQWILEGLRAYENKSSLFLKILKHYENCDKHPYDIQGKYLISCGGWEDHRISMIFFKNLMLIGNRGETTKNFFGIEIYRIDRTKLTRTIYLKTISTQSFVENELIEELKGELLQRISMRQSNYSNCSWSSAGKLNLIGIALIISIKKVSLEKISDRVINQCTLEIKHFKHYMNYFLLNKYLHYHSVEQLAVADQLYDPVVLSEIVYKSVLKLLNDKASQRQKTLSIQFLNAILLSGLSLDCSVFAKRIAECFQSEEKAVIASKKFYNLLCGFTGVENDKAFIKLFNSK